MKLTRRVKEILSWYESDTPGTKANLARILMEGKLGGTGRMVILPVDQGIEHSGGASSKAFFKLLRSTCMESRTYLGHRYKSPTLPAMLG